MELYYDPCKLIWVEAEFWFQGLHDAFPGTTGDKTITLGLIYLLIHHLQRLVICLLT